LYIQQPPQSQKPHLLCGLNARHIRFIALGSAIGTGLFYVCTLAILMAIFPWNSFGEQGSPFVLIFSGLGIPAAATILNIIVISASISAINSDIFGTGRMMYGMAKEGMVPESFQRIASNGVPWMTVVVMGVALLAAAALRLPGLRGVWSPGSGASRDPGCSPAALRLPGLRGIGSPGSDASRDPDVPRQRCAYRGYEVWSPGSGASRDLGCSPRSAYRGYGCGRPGQVQAATWRLQRCAYRGYGCGRPGQAQTATWMFPGGAALTGATGCGRPGQRKPRPGMLLRLRSAYRGYR
jgi:hypothetical protein